MNVLITGANGFLGRNLVEKFLKEGNNIYALSVNNNNLDRLNEMCFDSVRLEDISLLRENILSFNPDLVIHCAWDGGNAYRDINSLRQFDNVKYGLDFLRILTELDELYFVCIGSMSEYGLLTHKAEEEGKEEPNSLYGISKLAFKLYSQHICTENRFKWLWIRPSYVYGPGDVKTRLIPRTIIKCLRSEDLILNSCESRVDYVYIDDFIDGIDKLIELEKQGVYNVCSGEEYCVRDVVNTIHGLTDSNISVSFDSAHDRKNFSNYICGSNDKLSKTSWIPRVTLEQGLAATINYLKGEINGR